MIATAHTYDRDDLALLLAPRQAEIMRLFWSHGPATVRQVRQWLASDDDIPAYTTIATICVRLVEKGLLQQRMEDAGCQDRQAYIYTPLTTEADFVRDAVTQQLDGLLAQYPDLVAQYIQRAGAGAPGECAGDRATENNVAYQAKHDGIEMRNSKLKTQNSELAERAEAAERQAAAWEAEARRAQQVEQSSTARLEQAEARAIQWEAAAHRATAQALLAEEDASVAMRRAALQGYGAARSAPEHYDFAGVCRVCNEPIPDVPARRRDGLRVCAGEMCQREACRRDHAAKQRDLRARRRMEREDKRALAR